MDNLKSSQEQEARRIASLRSHHIIDTLSETEYDDIAKLASAICGTPVALVTFVDENWQYFKAKVGTDFEGTPREIAFCEYTIRVADAVMVVEDMTLDPRFANNPLVTENPNIRFYAGAPFTTEEGYALGTVCVLDVVPRKLSQQQIDSLHILSRQVSALLKTRKMNVELGTANRLLKGRNKEMKGELQTLAAEKILEISAKNEELQRINNELETFAYVSSHDLQEPLRKIQTFASWLELKELDNLSLKGKDYLMKIEGAADRMQRLIQDLLYYSRVSMSTKTFEETTLQKIIDPVLEDLEEEIRQKNARVDIIGDGRLFIIEYQFRQLLYNLLSNALKYSKKDFAPHITITLSYEAATGTTSPQFRVDISDNGIGFDNQYNERIFTLFQRLSTEKKIPGTGIGLTMVRKIVNNHAGTIAAEGKENEGAVFTVRFPDQMVL